MAKKSKQNGLHFVAIRVTSAVQDRINSTFKTIQPTKVSEVYSLSDHMRALIDLGLLAMEKNTIKTNER